MEFWYVLTVLLLILLTIISAASLILMASSYSWYNPHHVLPVLAIIIAFLPISTQLHTRATNGKVCIHYPSYAEQNLDADWKTTFLYMMNVKSFNPNSVIFMPYDDIITSAAKCKDDCFADFWLMETGMNNVTDITTAVAYLSYEWLCSDMDVSLYFYTQNSENDFFVGSGLNCSMHVCLLDTATTLGKGCVATDDTTFETVSGNTKSAIVDVTDEFTYRLSVDSTQCKWRFCTQGERKNNVFVLTMGPAIDIDDAMQTQQKESVEEYQVYQTRIQWKEWWNMFYKLVEIANKVISSLSGKMRTDEQYTYAT